MLNTPPIFALLAFLVTFLLMMLRPFKITEGTAGLVGALLMFLLGFIRFVDIKIVLDQTGNLLIMLFSMMVISLIVDEAGFFRWFASLAANKAQGNGKKLFLNTFLLGLAVTTVISNDATALIITPIVWEYTHLLNLDPLPFLLTCTFIADTASLSLPVSNLTNILVYESMGLKFWDYIILMFFPNLVASMINYLVFAWLFRKRIPHYIDQSLLIKEPIANPRYFKLATWGLLTITLGYVIGSAFGLPLWVIAFLGAIYMCLIAYYTNKTSLKTILPQVSWSVLLFVTGMFLVVKGLENSGLMTSFSTAIANLTGKGLFNSILTVTFGTALGANVVNNVPMDMLMVSGLQKVKPFIEPKIFAVLPYSVIMGAGLGPNFTVIGSLATMLWLNLVRKKGYEITALQYSFFGLLTAPLMIFGASLALYLIYNWLYI